MVVGISLILSGFLLKNKTLKYYVISSGHREVTEIEI